MSATALTRTVRRRVRDVLFGSWYARWLLGSTDDEERSRSPVLASSWLVRWLTAEPEPDVIVIDLREVRMVRPFVLALDRVAGQLASALPYSWLGFVVGRVGDRLRSLIK